jgi:GT2 family glycosyltransferase
MQRSTTDLDWLVVLNWNGKSDTLRLLDSLQHADIGSTVVLVVDNGSSDGSLKAVRDGHPWVRTLQTGKNLGYAGGNNVGLRYAIAQGAGVVGVLNNDTIVEHGFWQPLLEQARSGQTAVSPDIRYLSDRDSSWFLGGVARTSEGLARHLLPDEQPGRGAPSGTEVLTGCCLVASSVTWQHVGLFDEGFFVIFEDSDWSLRARGRGVRLVVEPASRIYHAVSASFQDASARLACYYYCRNGLVFAWRWLGPLAVGRFLKEAVLRRSASDLRHHAKTKWPDAVLRWFGLMAALTGQRGPAGKIAARIAQCSTTSRVAMISPHTESQATPGS